MLTLLAAWAISYLNLLLEKSLVNEAILTTLLFW